jgi:protein-disulfide isomerase
MNNPQILVNVVNKLHQQQAAAAQQVAISIIVKNAAVLTGAFISPSIGSTNAKTVVVEFMDYQCSYCHQDYPVVKALIAAHPDVKFVFKEFPVFGATSIYAAGMAMAAQQQGKFEAYHNALFETGLMEGQLTNKAVDQVATKVGINLTQAKAWISTSSVSQELARNQSLASQLGIQGTPDFIVMPNSANPDPGKITFLPGAVSGSVLENAINQAQ